MAHPWCEAHMPVVPRLQGGFLNWYSTLANNVILLGILLQAQKAVAGGVPWKTWLITSSTHIAFIFFAADTRTYLDSSLKCLVNLTTSLHRCPDSDALTDVLTHVSTNNVFEKHFISMPNKQNRFLDKQLLSARTKHQPICWRRSKRP